MPAEMHVLVNVCAQTGPSDYEIEPVIVRVTDASTIGEIREVLRRRRALSKPGYATVATLVMLEDSDAR